MNDYFLILACLTLFLYCVLGIEFLVGLKGIPYLRDTGKWRQDDGPLVSIVIPALNEGESIEKTLRSIMALEYPNFEVIAVNDRSTDNTGTILERWKGLYPNLTVIEVDTLPASWLGKPHALYQGARRSKGEYILFSDADVLLEKSALGRAMRYMVEEKLDHLAVTFDIVPHGGLYNMMLIEVGIGMLSILKPWRASNQNRPESAGVGAFNLVSREAYLESGTHEAIANHVIDDIGLGILIKSNGFKQEFLMGEGLITVDWYSSTRHLIEGLEKNVFAAFNFRISGPFGVTLLMIALVIWPHIGLFLTEGFAFGMNAIVVLLRFSVFCAFACVLKFRFVDLLWYPVTPFVALYTLWNSVLVTLIRGGIRWRGTHYPRNTLKGCQL